MVISFQSLPGHFQKTLTAGHCSCRSVKEAAGGSVFYLFFVLAPELVPFFICFALVYIEPICHSSAVGCVIFKDGHEDAELLQYCPQPSKAHSLFYCHHDYFSGINPIWTPWTPTTQINSKYLVGARFETESPGLEVNHCATPLPQSCRCLFIGLEVNTVTIELHRFPSLVVVYLWTL